MIKVAEACLADFEEVFLLYQKLNPDIDKSVWQGTFFDHFNANAFPGYVLKDDEKVVGFFGTIFSTRNFNGKEYKFCNCHSWIVDDNYRSKGLLLLNRIHKLKDCIITNFSASPDPFAIMKTLKWIEIDDSHTIFLANPLTLPFSSAKKVLKGDEMLSQLNAEEKAIANDHQKFRCAQNMVRTYQGNSFQIYKPVDYFPAKAKRIERYLPFKFKLGHLYYSSNPELFFQDFKSNLCSVCKKENWLGLIVPNRFMKHLSLSKGKKYYHRRPILIRTDKEFDFDRLDLLYSEVFVLDLN